MASGAYAPEHSAEQLLLFPQNLMQPPVQVTLAEQLPSGAAQKQESKGEASVDKPFILNAQIVTTRSTESVSTLRFVFI
jgi:hypothetical protein